MDDQFPTEPFDAFRASIEQGVAVIVTYKGNERRVCPYVLGSFEGVRRVLVWQYAGKSSSGLKSAGDWRIFDLSSVSDVSPCNDPWIEKTRDYEPQRGIDSIIVARPGFDRTYFRMP